MSIDKLSKEVQERLSMFLDGIPKTKFFQPDGNPKKEWKMFYGNTWDSAREIAWEIARDFSLQARMIVVSDLDYPGKEKHEAHVLSRIEVWQKGYGLLCDVNGVLYVYVKKGQ